MARHEGLSIDVSPEVLRPLVEQVIDQALARLDEARGKVPADRMAYSEQEGARLLSLAPHQLRDERHRGRIAASHVVGKRVRYLRADLLNYLMRKRTGEASE